MRPVILYGPPAVGKDTITAALSRLNPDYSLFPVLKAGAGRVGSYRLVEADDLDDLDLVVRWNRYGNTYAIDRAGLDQALSDGRPIVHLGDPTSVGILADDNGKKADWLVVELFADRAEIRERLRQRDPQDAERRIAVLNGFPMHLTHPDPDLAISTSRFDPETVAAMILAGAGAGSGWLGRSGSPA